MAALKHIGAQHFVFFFFFFGSGYLSTSSGTCHFFLNGELMPLHQAAGIPDSRLRRAASNQQTEPQHWKHWEPTIWELWREEHRGVEVLSYAASPVLLVNLNVAYKNFIFKLNPKFYLHRFFQEDELPETQRDSLNLQMNSNIWLYMYNTISFLEKMLKYPRPLPLTCAGFNSCTAVALFHNCQPWPRMLPQFEISPF